MKHWSAEYHKRLAIWHELMARYHARKAIDPLSKIPIPKKPTN